MRGKIGVWGHFHGGNIGDDIVVATLLASIRERLPTHELHGFSLKPSDTAWRHQVASSALSGGPVFPVAAAPSEQSAERPPVSPKTVASAAEPARRSTLLNAAKRLPGANLARRMLRRTNRSRHIARQLLRDLRASPATWRRLRSFDAVFVAGSGPVFDDMGGTWAHPYNLLRWAVLCRLAGTRFCLMNVGAGPINQPLSRRLLSWALRLSYYHSFRDKSSVRLVTSLGLRKPAHLGCDMAFAVPEDELATARCSALHLARPAVGVAPMAYMDSRYWHNADTSVADRYLDALAGLSVWLLQEGYDLILLKSQRFADERTASELMVRIRQQSPDLDESRIVNPETRGHPDLLRQIAGCEFVVGGRFHCHVLPFVLGIPVLGVSYHPKTDELMKQMKQDQYFVDMNDVTDEALIKLFLELRRNRAEAAREIRRQAQQHRTALQRQFDTVFSAVFIA